MTPWKTRLIWLTWTRFKRLVPPLHSSHYRCSSHRMPDARLPNKKMDVIASVLLHIPPPPPLLRCNGIINMKHAMSYGCRWKSWKLTSRKLRIYTQSLSPHRLPLLHNTYLHGMRVIHWKAVQSCISKREAEALKFSRLNQIQPRGHVDIGSKSHHRSFITRFTFA